MKDDDKIALLQLTFYAAVIVLIAFIISGCMTIRVIHQPYPMPPPSVLERMDYARLPPLYGSVPN